MKQVNVVVQLLGQALWRWDVIAIVSPLLYASGIGAMYADDYIEASLLYFAAIAWLTAKILAWEENKAHPQRPILSAAILIAGLVVFAASLEWVKHRREIQLLRSVVVLEVQRLL